MKIKQSFSLILLLFISQYSFGQTFAQYLKAGEKAYQNSEYFAAISYFEKATQFKIKSDEIRMKIGNSYLELKDYNKAISSYKEVKEKSKFPIVSYKLASSLMLTGDYQNAIKNFETFKNNYRIQDFYFDDAIQKLASCHWALDHLKLDENIKIIALDRSINTEFSEFSPSYFKDSLLQITSFFHDEESKKDDYVSNILFYENINEKWENRTIKLDTEKNLEPANGFYLKEKERFYFNQCEASKNGKKRCDIYVSKFENDTWSKAIALNLNDKNFTSTQAFVYVNDDGKDVIYFASDRANGMGQNDIWKAVETNFGVFEKLEVLSEKVNSKGNETSPFFDKNTYTLYFSSDWFYGFGGLDIFKLDLSDENAKPTNLGLPFNSSANDLYLKYTSEEKGFFSSNREGAMKLRGASCCYDIFEFEKNIEKTSLTKDSISTLENLITIHKTDSIKTLLSKIEKMIPLTVYFHNDEPNPKTIDTTTLLTYTDAYNSFKNLKNDYYAQNDFESIDAFFYDNLDLGFNELQNFEKLLASISSNFKIKLILKGYCSPLAENQYNFNLAKRRISSVENYFKTNSKLKEAIEKGNLKIEHQAFGEEKANSKVSDYYFDTKASIYNTGAALERKVSIISIIVE